MSTNRSLPPNESFLGIRLLQPGEIRQDVTILCSSTGTTCVSNDDDDRSDERLPLTTQREDHRHHDRQRQSSSSGSSINDPSSSTDSTILYVGQLSSNYGIFTLSSSSSSSTINATAPKTTTRLINDDKKKTTKDREGNPHNDTANDIINDDYEDDDDNHLKKNDTETTILPTTTTTTTTGGGGAVVDFVLKTSDGWTKSEITTILNLLRQLQQQTNTEAATASASSSTSSSINFKIDVVEGYPERMRARHEHETTPSFIHATYIRIIQYHHHHHQQQQDEEGGGRDGEPRKHVIEFRSIKEQSEHQKNPQAQGCDRDESFQEQHHTSSSLSSNPTNGEHVDNAISTTSTNDDNHDDIATSTTNNPNPNNTHRGANDYSRFAKVVSFLLEEFGSYRQLSKAPILDIGGGASGGLAFELVVRHSLRCVTVDTKPLQLSPRQTKHLKYRQQCSKSLLLSLSGDTICSVDGNSNNNNGIDNSPLALHLYHRFSSPSSSSSSPSSTQPQLQQLITLLDSNDVLHHCSQLPNDHGCGFDNENNTNGDGDVDDKSQLRALLRSKQCSVIVGLHPDEATDHIIDVGLELQLPWVVIPCCVFPSLFRERRTRDGRIVRSYDDLCDYILGRHPNVQETTLSFRGRNRVFYWSPCP